MAGVEVGDSGVRRGGVVVLTFLAVPFLVTGLFRILPAVPLFSWTLVPFVLLGGALLVLWNRAPAWRTVSVAGWASLVIYLAFLIWLFADHSDVGGI